MMDVIKKDKQIKWIGLGLLFFGAFLVHVVFAAAYVGYETDMNCFSWWSSAVFEHGVNEFYHLEAFTDYPPGYMYILYVIGAIRSLFNMGGGLDTLSVVLLKMPAMLCDLGIGYVIYHVASKYTKHNYAMLFSAAFMLNPSVVINSATWGQVDSVFTLFIVLMCFFITEKKLPWAYFMFAISILMKPQALIFTPVLIFGIIDQVFLQDFTWKRMWKELLIGLSAILALGLLMAPFGLSTVISQYVDTIGQYECASVNAYNFWTMLGFNWTSQDNYFIFMSFKNWGYFFIVATVAFSAWFCLRNKEWETKYYLTAGFIITSVFMLSVRMHERYMYPVLALLLIAAAVKRNYRYILAYILLSFIHFLNVYHVLFYYAPDTYDFNNPLLPFISALGVGAFVYFVIVLIRYQDVPRARTEDEMLLELGNNKNKKGTKNNKSNKVSQKPIEKRGAFSIMCTERTSKWNKWDWIIIAIITVVYGCVAFYNLGDRQAPETKWESQVEQTEISLDFGETIQLNEMFCFLGNFENRKFSLMYSEDGVNWNEFNAATNEEENSQWINFCSVFCWNKQTLGIEARYLKFAQQNNESVVFEWMFYDTAGNTVLPINASEYPELFDEQDIFDGKMTYMNSTYFDEIYHARTAYEMINDLYCYENTHPPLGKFIISIGIRMFGMNPFGWRFMGTLFGILMVPIMFLLARKLTNKTWLATVFTLLFTFDFMHFSQTRIATIDVYVTFFIMLMYYFMLCYYKMSFYDTPFKKTLIPLALSGIFMGFGCASKWTGVYAGLGLGVIFLLVMIRRYKEYKTALRDIKGKTGEIEHRYIVDHYSIYTLKTLAFCVLAFVIVPGLIYLASYIPFSNGTGNGLVSQMLQNQNQMFSYHSTLDATHPYSSVWYQWPIITRPILYYLESVSEGVSSGISSMGNPLVWWAGIPAFIYMIYLIFKKRDRIAMFLSIGYLAQFLPWLGVSRCTFIYHYFPSVPFVVMMIGFSIYQITKDKPKLRKWAILYTILVVVLFVAFYPIMSGYPISIEYGKGLKWLNSWVLIY